MSDFPIDWNQWREEWKEWTERNKQHLGRSSYRFGPSNFLADTVIGVYSINQRNVELSEVTFPDLGSGSFGKRNRYVGITFGQASGNETALASSWEELEDILGIRQVTDA